MDWTLDAVLTAAIAQNPLVAAARAQVTAAQGSRRTATTLPNPVATYWMEGPHEVSAYATLPLEPFLQRSARTARAGADLGATQAGVTSVERDVARDAARAFYRVALAQASLDAVRENQTAVQQLADYLHTRVAQGASPEGEAIRAEVERDRAATEVTLADVELIRAQAALRPWLGADSAPLGTLRVTTPAAARAGTPLAPIADFETHAFAERPELLESRARVDAARGTIAVERSVLIRQLGASFGLKRTAGTNALIAGVSMTVPLFDRNRGEIQRATGEQLAAEASVRWLERVIAGEVDAAYQVAVRLAAQVAALQPAFLQRAEESRRIALGAYQEGAAPLLQVLDASRALTDARLIYARALVAAHESVFELGVAAGYDAPAAARLQGGSR
jgi:cobalt-zinc-cadmium efflux system outer membrane protein